MNEPRPPVRNFSVVAQDPSVRDEHGNILMATISIPAEDLGSGPIGYRVHVVDYDATIRRYYGSHALPLEHGKEPEGWQRGNVESILGDFRFHAQNVYAIVMKTLARFEFALGRRLGWSFGTHQLKVAPHGMVDANAFYSPQQEGLVFGYFQGTSKPVRPVYTCLSHDIIVHETTHALVDALRDHFLNPSTPDQAAFHEGFADVIALLSVFSLPEVVGHLLASGSKSGLLTRKQVSVEALRESAVFGLADEMGEEIAGIRGEALRRSARLQPDPKLIDDPEFLEPHRRGEIFVAAVINAFIRAWSARVYGSGTEGQAKFPLDRVVEEGASIADALATMMIRALDYMPPVHLEFGDALSAALTADSEVRPDDSRYQLRTHLVQQFAAYGVKPASKRKDRPGIWDPAPANLVYDRVRFESMRSDKDEVFRFIWENRTALGLRDGAYTEVKSVRPCTRIGTDGFVLRETIVEYYQMAELTPAELLQQGVRAPRSYLAALRKLKTKQAKRPLRAAAAHEHEHDDDGADAVTVDATGDDAIETTTPLYGGGVLVFDEYGRVKYAVHNDVFGTKQSKRLEYMWAAGLLQARNDRARYKQSRLSSLHMLRALDARRSPREGW
jgi:hypothetical protein